jgi:hypothetical protein
MKFLSFGCENQRERFKTLRGPERLQGLKADPEIRESSSSSSSCSSSIYPFCAEKRADLPGNYFVPFCVTVRILADDDEHENEDDFSTSEFRIESNM